MSACEGQILGGPAGGPNARDLAPPAAWPIHLLTTAEYNHTVADLLGTASRPADYFPATSATEFDANTGVLGDLSPVAAEAVVEAARALTAEVFASPTLRAAILTCAPATDTDTACPRRMLGAFARRAWRRTPDAEEVDALVALYTSARTTLTLAHQPAMAHAVRAILSSPSFFLRVERLPADPSLVVEPAALASRLSYLLWSSQPDQALLDAAEAGALGDPDAVAAQVDRLLADPRGQRFVDRFLGQWLGFARLPSHGVDPRLFPQWSAAVARGAERQASAYLNQFLGGPRPFREFLSAPHPAAAELAPLLANDPAGVRRGFLTLPGFLAVTSHSDRTSPTARAKAIVSALLCTDLTPPPGVVAMLPADAPGPGTPQTVRAQLEAHRQNPACAGCHDTLDPLGLSLENFDAVGTWRTREGPSPIDASGTWQGTPFTDVRGLLPELEKDPRLADCAPRKLVGYALRRSLVGGDAPTVAALAEGWQQGSLLDLVHAVVATPAFSGTRQERAP